MANANQSGEKAAVPPLFIFALRNVTEAAAREAYKWIGLGQKDKSDVAAADDYDAFADEIEIYGVFCHGCNYSGGWLVMTGNKLHCQRW